METCGAVEEFPPVTLKETSPGPFPAGRCLPGSPGQVCARTKWPGAVPLSIAPAVVVHTLASKEGRRAEGMRCVSPPEHFISQ